MDLGTQNCLVLDKKILNYDLTIADLSQKAISNSSLRNSVESFRQQRLEAQKLYVKGDCNRLIEEKKTLENADILKKGFNQSEDEIINPTNKTKINLLLLGGGVLLLGLIIISK